MTAAEDADLVLDVLQIDVSKKIFYVTIEGVKLQSTEFCYISEFISSVKSIDLLVMKGFRQDPPMFDVVLKDVFRKCLRLDL